MMAPMWWRRVVRTVIPGLLDGLPSVGRLVKRTLAARPPRPSMLETARKRA